MAVHHPNSLLSVTFDPVAVHEQDGEVDILPKTATAEILRLLEHCSEENVRETDFWLAAATTVLQTLKDTEGSGEVLETLQVCTLGTLGKVSLGGRQADTQLKSGVHSTSESKPEEESVFWCSCHDVAVASDDRELSQFTAALEILSQKYLHLVTSYLKVASKVLPKNEVMRFLSTLCKQWWFPEIISLLKNGGLMQLNNRNTPSMQDAATPFSKCIKNLAIVHVILSMQARISHCFDLKTLDHAQPSSHTHGRFPRAPGLLFPPSAPLPGRPYTAPDPRAVMGWLCSDALSPVLEILANTTPMVVYRQYQLWLEADQCESKGSTAPPTAGLRFQRGTVFRTCVLLSSTLTLLTDAAASSHTQVLLQSFTGTISRLISHYWQQLAQIIERVPEELPLRVWYLSLNSAIHLHSKLEEFEGLLSLTSSQWEEFAQVLHSVSEFCNILREQIEAYHSQLCLTSLLHDAASHDWPNSKPFYESERCSLAVQMWHYHLQGLRHDLWEVGLEGVAGKILGSVLAASVSQLARRYTSVQPSYRRVPQFRADILAILSVAASLLPCVSPIIDWNTADVTDTIATTTSGEVDTIHRSCAVLLGALAVGGCSLEQLVESLKSWQPDEGASPLLRIELVEMWMKFLDLGQFGIVPYTPVATPLEGAVNDLMAFVSLPYPKWALLLKLLLSRGGSLAIQLSRVAGAGGVNEGPFPHIALVLCYCFQQPQALSNLLVAMGDWTNVDSLDQQSASNCCIMKLLDQLLREALESCVLSRAGDFCCKLMQRRRDCPTAGGNLSAELLVPLMEDLEALVRRLPLPLLNALRDLSGHIGTAAANDRGITRLLAFLIGHWLVVPPTLMSQLPHPIPSLLGAYSATVKHVLEGTPTTGDTDLSFLSADLVQQLQRLSLALQERVKQFGSRLPKVPSSDSADDVSDVEHSIAAEILVGNRKALHSLEYLHTLLKTNKNIVMEMIHVGGGASHPPNATLTLPSTPEDNGTRFNPLKACLSLGNGAFDHQQLMEANVDWKNLLDNIALKALGRDLVQQLVTNRFEFQDGAPLQGNEPELVLSIQSLFHSREAEEHTSV